MLWLIISISVNAYFSPRGEIRNKIIKELDTAEKQILVAMYIFTDRELAQTLVQAANRGVKIKIVMDGTKTNEIKYSKHRFLDSRGIELKLDKTHISKDGKYRGIMHHKFAIIDNKILINGSYNWTHSAEELNAENILIVKEAPEILYQFIDEFKKLWEQSENFSIQEIPVVDPYNIKEIKENIGKYVTVVGKPTNWNISSSDHLFIDFGKGKNSFTFLLWKEGTDELKEKKFQFEKLDNSTVEIKGLLIKHKKYGYEIVTDNPDAIKIRE